MSTLGYYQYVLNFQSIGNAFKVDTVGYGITDNQWYM